MSNLQEMQWSFNPSTDWMAKSNAGILVHYVASIAEGPANDITSEEWQQTVNAFDVPKFVHTIKNIGIGHIIITLGQNSGYYCSPNDSYDRVVGCTTDDMKKTSSRDLIRDIIDELRTQDVAMKVMLYLPSHPPAEDQVAVEDFGWLHQGLDGYNPISPSVEASSNWYKVIEEWSVRYGEDLAGWWFDGVYDAEIHDFAAFTAAAKKGNANAVVACNAGVKALNLNPYDDYTAGEQQDLSTDMFSPGRWTKGLQNQLLTPLGKNWLQGGMKYSDQQLLDFLIYFRANESTVTFDTPIGLNSGELYEDHIAQLTRVLNKLASK